MCLATQIVILRNSPRLNTFPPAKVLASVGNFSYSLYLVHWPIIAFINNSWVGNSPELPFDLRLMALLLSFAVAYLLYRFVEDPVRKSDLSLSAPLFAKIALSSVLLVSITPLAIQAMPREIDFTEARRANFGFSEACEYKTLFAPRNECRNSKTPKLLVWGDSFAMHLVPGVLHEWKNGGVIQATRSQCGPFLGLAPRRTIQPEHGTVMDKTWAEQCIQFNQSVVDFLHTANSIEIVVLSSPISEYLIKDNYEHVMLREDTFVSVPVSTAAVQSSLRRTVEEIRSLGKKVVLVAPPPSSEFDIGGCLERHLSGRFSLGGQQGCVIDLANYHSKRADVLNFLESLAANINVSVIRFDPWLCTSQFCKTTLDGTMLYRDAGHLSYAGSKLLAERMHLAALISDQAK